MLFGNKIICTVVNCKHHTTKDTCGKRKVHVTTHESIAKDFRSTDCMSFEHMD
ncbi:DUF1540 domain-containing protein [Desulfuribacillus alkaliarsenatis]|uniref:DUF1540 domain-containing protein n=1 Tax=Desulfuribacillus alkaliarsenatis TaxID=766136 RepID=UPI0009FC3DC6|nr:DUF1540 domain-containing protein [Desulfuribacillus alkaliarsenatis]